MGIGTRFKNIILGKANSALDEIENPIEQLNLSIKNKEEAVAKAKREAARFIGSVNTEERKLEELKVQASNYKKAAIAKAKENDQEGFAKWHKKEQDALSEVNAKETTVKNIKTQSDMMTKKIKQLDDDIVKLKTSKDNLSARLSTANAVADVNEIFTGLDKNCNVSIGDIERKIEEKENYANGLDAFNDNSDEELSDILAGQFDTDMAGSMEKYKNM